jgi:hypothetical protein
MPAHFFWHARTYSPVFQGFANHKLAIDLQGRKGSTPVVASDSQAGQNVNLL